MKKQLVISGMSCGHCSSRVKNTLEEVDGISGVTVDLGTKIATFEMTKDLSNDVLENLIADIGFEVVDIK